MNKKFNPVLPTVQQTKLHQLQLEVAALEEEVANYLKKQMQLSNDYNLQSPIPLIYVNDQRAKTGIRLAHDTNI